LGIAEIEEGEFEVCERRILVKRGDAKGFAKGLQYLIQNRRIWEEISDAGRSFVAHTNENLFHSTLV